MEKVKELKNVKQVFRDYNSSSFELNEAIVTGINLYKKENILAIFIKSKKRIDIKDILALEEYIEKRFQVKSAKVNIQYDLEQNNTNTDNNQEIDEISNKIISQWPSIVEYISHRHPIAKAFLKGSTIEIVKNKILVTLMLNGKEFLQTNKFNEVFSNVIENIYGKKYVIEYTEKVSEDKVAEYKENLERLEKETIMQIAQEAAEAKSSVKEATDNTQNTKTHSKKQYNKQYNKQYDNSQYAKKNSNESNSAQAPTDMPMPETQDAPPIEDEDTPLIYGRSLNLKDPITKIQDIGVESGNVILEGKILKVKLDDKDDDINLDIKTRELKSGKFLIIFSVYDGTNTIDCKIFAASEKVDKIKKRLKDAAKVRIAGTAQFDPYAKQLGILANTVIDMPEEKTVSRMDNAEIKRVELHLHTQMSTMDGVTPAKDLIKRAMKWGMKSIAITDHGSVQAFPDAHKMLGVNNPDMKVLYGVEAYLVPDKVPCVSNPKGQDLRTTYCVLDLETTGLSFRTEKITEIGIMKMNAQGEVIDEFECFVNPEKPIPQRVVEVTNITDEMVKDAETIEQVLPKVLEFV
ncbi:MAG: PHP domain-containing protein, partial [Clostridia bacterium]